MAFPRWLASSAFLIASASPALVRAEGPAPALSLEWKAPERCPTQADVVAEVRRLLGGKIDADPPVRARGAITEGAPSVFTLTLSMGREASERLRTVEAPTCAELGDAAALILALAIDPAAVASVASAGPTSGGDAPGPGGGASSSRGAATRSHVDAPPPPPPPASPSPDPVRAAPAFVPPAFARPEAPGEEGLPWLFRAHAAFAGDAGTFPSLAAGGHAGASFSRGPLRIEAATAFAWGGHIGSADAPSKGGDFWLAAGALLGCYEHELVRGPGAVAVAGCAGIEGGVVGASSVGVTQPGWGLAPWVAPAASGMVRWPLSPRMALRMDLSLAVPLVRSSFHVDGLGRIHEVGAVTGRVGAGLEVDLAEL